ncbi:TlyA family RNA methyltransferase [Clostridium akagii]|uniref:TlyA family RNA methyltransferase n=1 Tax=Clostridium akagii TaxID=91623 RepID=UPI0004793646|nr:TlyA family RNA methyltransferase [Clostridium akagii]
MAETKERLDVLLVKKGFFESREKAKASIMAGEIFIDDVRFDKCGENVKENSNIIFKGEKMPYVSRGGYKLAKAMAAFNIELKNKVCFDIGASTGGFTDCMLQNGATKVFAIDVGYGQFAWKLRVDPRVVCMERRNIRYVKPEEIGEQGDFASIDVSFISLRTVIPAVLQLLTEEGEIVALIKPQFEAGRENVGKKGVVKDPKVHAEVIGVIVDFLILKNLNIIDIDYSPIKGPEGNIEYLVYFSKNTRENVFSKERINQVVNKAHGNLD